ncbi:prolipoprotein diacylglyceryl transferase [Candidatus Babeliales bacterium]|nr:prolipoprotein diacylglyceryl transferase [Candidatus Babeliales bacterium]
MYPRIADIYGPIAIHSYGLAIVLGLICALYFLRTHPTRKKLISETHFYTLISWSILAGLIGGHLMYVFTEVQSINDYWHAITIGEGFGLSILGTILGVLVFLIFYLRHHKIPVLHFLDMIAPYAALAQAFGRVGCFFAGCCYGAPTAVAWAVTFTNPEGAAPLCIALHPSQLYSAGLLFLLFLLMHFFFQHLLKKPGQQFMLYLFFVNIIRFVTDFFRGDRTIRAFIARDITIEFSYYQWIALTLAAVSLILLLACTYQKRKTT